jgi:hypothetical protein
LDTCRQAQQLREFAGVVAGNAGLIEGLWHEYFG